jgi:hypothetical protein
LPFGSLVLHSQKTEKQSFLPVALHMCKLTRKLHDLERPLLHMIVALRCVTSLSFYSSVLSQDEQRCAKNPSPSPNPNRDPDPRRATWSRIGGRQGRGRRLTSRGRSRCCLRRRRLSSGGWAVQWCASCMLRIGEPVAHGSVQQACQQPRQAVRQIPAEHVGIVSQLSFCCRTHPVSCTD